MLTRSVSELELEELFIPNWVQLVLDAQPTFKVSFSGWRVDLSSTSQRFGWFLEDELGVVVTRHF